MTQLSERLFGEDDTPCRLHQTHIQQWAFASILATLRRQSHAGRRRSHEDRGDQNSRVDLQGAIGELVLLETLEAQHLDSAAEYVRSHLYLSRDDLQDEADQPDVVFDDGLGLDVKTFDWAEHKQYLAVNKRKHEALRGACDAYYWVMVCPFGTTALEMTIPYDAVSSWDDWSLGTYGSPSHNRRVHRVLESKGIETSDLSRFRERHDLELIQDQARQPQVQQKFHDLIGHTLPDQVLPRADRDAG